MPSWRLAIRRLDVVEFRFDSKNVITVRFSRPILTRCVFQRGSIFEGRKDYGKLKRNSVAHCSDHQWLSG